MSNNIVKVKCDQIYYFKNVLIILKGINNDTTLYFSKEYFYIQETNSTRDMKFNVKVYANSIDDYVYGDEIEEADIYCGFKCDDFIKKIGKVGKGGTSQIKLKKSSSNRKRSKNNSRIELINCSKNGERETTKYIDTFITDIQDKDGEEFIEYKDSEYKFNVKVSCRDFSCFFADLKNQGCTTAVIKAYESYMEIIGKMDKKDESENIFGRKKINFIVNNEKIFPIKYIIDSKKIVILSKLNTISTNTKLKFFFFKNKLVIKSKLSSIGKVIIEIESTNEAEKKRNKK